MRLNGADEGMLRLVFDSNCKLLLYFAYSFEGLDSTCCKEIEIAWPCVEESIVHIIIHSSRKMLYTNFFNTSTLFC